MAWKATPEQLERARQELAAERKKPHNWKQKKRKSKKQRVHGFVVIDSSIKRLEGEPPFLCVPRRDYRRYMKGPAWRARREWLLDRIGRQCEQCKSIDKITVHHRHYDCLGCERPSDVFVLCWECHQLKHEDKTNWGIDAEFRDLTTYC